MKPAGRFVAIGAGATFLAAILAGCAGYDITSNQGNYLTFQYPFTEAAAEEVRRKAVELCAFRKQAAVRSENVCNISRCTTSYQCVDKGDAPVPGK